MAGVNPGGLTGAESQAVLEQFVVQTGATFPIGVDQDNSYSGFRASGGGALSPFPLDVVVDQDGVIRQITREYEPAELRELIESLLP